VAERRTEQERRAGERRQLTLVPSEERRTRGTRRRAGDRRARPGRGAETTEEHVRNALQLLTTIAETESLDDELRRDLDAAIFRLHFAIERLQRGDR
jgi:hypothetical protein